MNLYIAVACDVCALVLALWILVRILQAKSQARKMAGLIDEYEKAVNALDWAWNEARLDAAIAELKACVAPYPGPGARVDTAANADVPAVPPPPDAVDEFVENMKRCKDAGMRIEPEMRTWANTLLEKGRPKSRGGQEIFRKNTASILQAMLHVADEEIDLYRENRPLQEALDAMAKLAGLQFIVPVEGSVRNEQQHEFYQATRSPGQIAGTIASVTRRGLVRPENGEVILKALVILYK